MLRTLYAQVSFGALLGVVLAAVILGGRAERIGAALLVVDAAASMAAQSFSGVLDPALALLVIDMLVMAGFVVLTARARRVWPFAAVGFQGVGLAVHVIRLLTHDMDAWIYLTALVSTSYGVLIALATGIWEARLSRLRGE